MITAMFVVFVVFSLLIMLCQLGTLARMMKGLGGIEEREKDYVFDEGELVDTLMKVMDESQDAMDRDGVGILRYPDLWESPYSVMLMKSLLYEMWGMGDNAFNEIRDRCLERNYPVTQAFAVIRSMRQIKDENQIGEMED